MQFQSPYILLLLLVVPLLWCFEKKTNRKRTAAVRFSSISLFKSAPIGWRARAIRILPVIRYCCLALLIIALARPRKGIVLSEMHTEGVALEIALDRSSTMEEEMVYKNRRLSRFEVAKKIFNEFILGDGQKLKGRSGDLVGLVTFARYPETICPLIHPSDILKQFLSKASIARLRSENATAIGDGIALAAARLKSVEDELAERSDQKQNNDNFKIKSKAIILLTDGRQNAGDLDPMQAAQLAKKWGIKIYTIGLIGKSSEGWFGHFAGRTDLDEVKLKAVADETGGFYARADDGESLKKVIEKIDQLEKTKVSSIQYTRFSEKFSIFTYAAASLLLVQMIAGCTVFRKWP